MDCVNCHKSNVEYRKLRQAYLCTPCAVNKMARMEFDKEYWTMEYHSKVSENVKEQVYFQYLESPNDIQTFEPNWALIIVA